MAFPSISQVPGLFPMAHGALGGPGGLCLVQPLSPSEDLQHTMDCAIIFTDLAAFQLYCVHTSYM